METDRAAEIFFGLGDPLRLQLYLALLSAPDGLLVSELALHSSRQLATVSSALSTMRRAGLVSSTNEGTRRRYRAELRIVNEAVAWLLSAGCS